MTKKLKVGVIGVGALGQHHTRVYSQLENTELVGVFDINPARAEEIAKAHNTKAFSNLDELISNIQAVSVVVPTDKHLDMFMKLVDKGIHMLMEKPIAASTAEAEQMVKLAEKKGLILQVGHIERFNPIMEYLEKNITKPQFIEVIRLASYPPPRPNAPPRGTEVSVVLDLMIHDIEIILHLVRSEVRELHAVGVSVLSPTEDIANVRLIFKNGCIANVTSSRISQERMRKIRVFQPDAYVSLDYMNQAGQIYRKIGSQIKVEDVPIHKHEPLMAELSSFVNCALTKSEPAVTGRQASEALKIAVEICRVIRENPS